MASIHGGRAAAAFGNIPESPATKRQRIEEEEKTKNADLKNCVKELQDAVKYAVGVREKTYGDISESDSVHDRCEFSVFFADVT